MTVEDRLAEALAKVQWQDSGFGDWCVGCGLDRTLEQKGGHPEDCPVRSALKLYAATRTPTEGTQDA